MAMLKDNDIITIQKKIGYIFKDLRLLERAFTHSSQSKNAQENYQSLEFLGDSILDFVVAKRLMEINPNAHEGTLTKLRAQIVSREPLSKEVEHLDLAKYLIVGKGENKDYICAQEKIKSDIFESIIGAIYLDSGKIELAEKFILAKLSPLFDGSAKHPNGADFKSRLNEYASKRDVQVEYRLVSAVGEAHCPTFTCEVAVDSKTLGMGVAKTKREAEQICAKEALKQLGEK